MNKLRDFLNEKYGEFIVSDILTKDNKVMATKEKRDDESKRAVKEQMKKFVKEDLLGETDYKKIEEWSFDFSAWMGKFEPKGKEVMIVGLEPHIQENAYQTIYWFGEKSNNDIREDNPLNKLCFRFLNRLCFLFNEEKKFKNNELDKKILQKFYITDLCHFTPKGNGNQIQGVSNWKDIRKKVADKFLKKEIEIVKPKIILAQGRDVFKFFEKELALSDIKVQKIETGYKSPKEYRISFATYENIKVIGIPHLGSKHNLPNKFWKNKITVVKKIIHKQIDL